MAQKETIEISLRYYNLIADMTGKSMETLSCSNGTCITGLLEELQHRYAPFAEYMGSKDSVKSTPLRLFRNGEIQLNFDQTLCQGDKILIFPIISGG